MKPVLKRLFDHLIRIGKQDLSSPSRSGYYQPDSRKLKEILNKDKNKATGKVFKSLIVLCMAVMTVFNMFSGEKVYAQESEKTMVLEFQGYTYDSNMTQPENTYLLHTFEMDREIYTLYDSLTDHPLETFVIETGNSPNALSGTYDMSFYHDKVLYDNNWNIVVTIRYTLVASVYSSGSFRQFNAIRNSGLTFADTPITSMSIENQSCNAWSNTGVFPCLQIDFNYICNVKAARSADASINASLIYAGFSFGSSTSNYAYRYLNESGSFTMHM